MKKSKLNIPAPRPTFWAYFYVFYYIGLPLLGIALLLDIGMAIFYSWQDLGCWSWFCWFSEE